MTEMLVQNTVDLEKTGSSSTVCDSASNATSKAQRSLRAPRLASLAAPRRAAPGPPTRAGGCASAQAYAEPRRPIATARNRSPRKSKRPTIVPRYVEAGRRDPNDRQPHVAWVYLVIDVRLETVGNVDEATAVDLLNIYARTRPADADRENSNQ